jgi:hypothetical protein
MPDSGNASGYSTEACRKLSRRRRFSPRIQTSSIIASWWFVSVVMQAM